MGGFRKLQDRIEAMERNAGETEETLKAHARRLKDLERMKLEREMYPGKVIFTNGPVWGNSILEQYADALGRAEMMLSDTKLRESLINLGWTPPSKEKCEHRKAGTGFEYREHFGYKHCPDCGEKF